MNQASFEGSIRRHVAEIGRLQPDPVRLKAALDRAFGETAPRSTAGRRWSPLVAGLACLLLGAAVATASTGVLDPALDSFFGGGAAPGQQISAEEGPSWLKPAPDYNAPSEASVVASSGGEVLYAYRQSGSICFMYGTHVGDCRSPDEWRHELEKDLWILRGPVGKAAWFGLVTTGIASVQVEYAGGETVEVEVSNDGFVAVVDQARDPQRIVGLDSSGGEVVSKPLATGGL